MPTIELEAEINEQHQLNLTLPANTPVGTAKVIVQFEPKKASGAPIKLGLFRDKIRMSSDFDAPLPDGFWLGG